ncbi:hypothetical protein PGTUg99_021363 [Puccinia graminis f. sp. tritici]|uniref:Uncharacterized protein n=1 Tax=Puccinia graminis f. sp. tritici TaxID=56615 RepID=A0A5B0S360_PUCGR|nr:hypothetical protein PGTUg99_021363 [Puccinia graminis f. sp. tritici]
MHVDASNALAVTTPSPGTASSCFLAGSGPTRVARQADAFYDAARLPNHRIRTGLEPNTSSELTWPSAWWEPGQRAQSDATIRQPSFQSIGVHSGGPAHPVLCDLDTDIYSRGVSNYVHRKNLGATKLYLGARRFLRSNWEPTRRPANLHSSVVS